MTKNAQYPFEPDYLVPPGDVLDDYLESLSMTQAELADRTGLAKKTINEIIQGKSPITPETALKFERTLGRPAHFWNNLERQYQEDRTRLEEKRRLKSRLDWLKNFPLKAMIQWGWINKQVDRSDQLEEVLRFFGIASPDQWEAMWGEYQVAFRQTDKIQVSPFSVSAWLRKGELDAQNIECDPFDKKLFLGVLKEIRHLTLLSPQEFLGQLRELCAAAGVAVVFVPELPKTGIYGATRWMGDKAVIQLSLRYKSNDHLWFTFFHEAGHIIKHGRKDVFLEGNGLDKKKEEEANAFARDLLIPPSEYRQFMVNWDNRSLQPIKVFAERIGIAPGIVVGRLQHDNQLPKSHGNHLKLSYQWSDGGK